MKIKPVMFFTILLMASMGLTACGGGSGGNEADGETPDVQIRSDILTLVGMPSSFESGETKEVEFQLIPQSAQIAAAISSKNYCFRLVDESSGNPMKFTPGSFCLNMGETQKVLIQAPTITQAEAHTLRVEQSSGISIIDISNPTIRVDVMVKPDPGTVTRALVLDSSPQKIESGKEDTMLFRLEAISLPVADEQDTEHCFMITDQYSQDKITLAPQSFCLSQVGSEQSVKLTAPSDVSEEVTHVLNIAQTSGDKVEIDPTELHISVTPVEEIEKSVVVSPAQNLTLKLGQSQTLDYTLKNALAKDDGKNDEEKYCFTMSDTTTSNPLSFAPDNFCLQGIESSQAVVVTMSDKAPAGEVHYIKLTQTEGKAITLPQLQQVIAKVAKPPQIIGYFINYGVYGNNSCIQGPDSPGRAIPYVSYPMPRESYTIAGAPIFRALGNDDCEPIPNSEQTAALNNLELVDKIKSGKLTGIAYAFLFIYDNPQSLPSGASLGQLRFSDGYSDLEAKDKSWCNANDLQFRLCTSSTAVNRGDDLTWYVKYGNFDAFADLDQYNPNLNKIVSIGGWDAINWNVYQTGDAKVDQVRIQNLIDSVQALASRFNFNEVDLDVEEDGKTANFLNFLGTSGNLALIIQRLHDEVKTKSGDKLKVSLTIQANPKYVNAIKDSVLAAGNLDKLESLNLMTYDFTVPGSTGHTGFNQVLFMPDPGAGTVPNEFTIGNIVQVTKAAMPGHEEKINIGLAAYTRSLNGYNNPGISANHGFGNAYDTSNTQLLGGDNDGARCSRTLAQGNSCASSFNHRYLYQFIQNGETHSFIVNNNGKDYHVGSTLIIPDFTAPQPKSLFGFLPTTISPFWSSPYTGDSVFFYTSGVDAYDYGKYAAEQGIGGAIMWTIDGDVPIGDTQNSLIHNFYEGYTKG